MDYIKQLDSLDRLQHKRQSHFNEIEAKVTDLYHVILLSSVHTQPKLVVDFRTIWLNMFAVLI